MTTRRFALLAALVAAIVAVGCTHNDAGEPAWIHLDGIKVVAPATGAVTRDTGYYTSNIVAAYVVVHYPSTQKIDSVGLFRTPFTVPVLHDGSLDYIDFYAAVPHSGEMSMLPYYTFYAPVRIEGGSLQSGDTTDFGMLETTYDQYVGYPLLFEPFEPNEANIMFDSVVEWVQHDRDGARCGEGYGRVHVEPTETHKEFAVSMGAMFIVSDPTKIAYLELDYRGDLSTEVRMVSRRASGAALETKQVMVIYGSDGWKHLYVNLGRTWSEFSHHPEFNITFSALNSSGEGGDVYIDNVKLVTTSRVF